MGRLAPRRPAWQGKLYVARHDAAGRSAAEGAAAEDIFVEVARRAMGKVTAHRALPYSDANRIHHVDVVLEAEDGQWLNVDVKNWKRASRADAAHADDLMWVELRNILGKPGWLYGRAAVLAVRVGPRAFQWLDRRAVVEYVRAVVPDLDAVAPTHDDAAIGQVYARRSRPRERVVKLSLTDLVKRAGRGVLQADDTTGLRSWSSPPSSASARRRPSLPSTLPQAKRRRLR
jgi:hypothetical protein